MPISIPVTNTPISIPNFGQPVAEAINQFGSGILYTLVDLTFVPTALTLPTGMTLIGSKPLASMPYRRLVIALASLHLNGMTTMTYLTMTLTAHTGGRTVRIYGGTSGQVPGPVHALAIQILPANTASQVTVHVTPQAAGTATSGTGTDFCPLMVAEIPIPN